MLVSTLQAGWCQVLKMVGWCDKRTRAGGRPSKFSDVAGNLAD